MKKFNTLLTYVSSNRIWLITLGCLDLFFAFLAWVAYPGDFLSLVGLMIFVSLAAFVIPFVISIHKRSKIDAAFRRFLLEPDDTNEYLLCESAPASMRPYIHELAHHLRMQEVFRKGTHPKNKERVFLQWTAVKFLTHNLPPDVPLVS